MLWFDVEKRYLTTLFISLYQKEKLWFDVEKRYLTTKVEKVEMLTSCGLM